MDMRRQISSKWGLEHNEIIAYSCEEQDFIAYFINLRYHGLSDTPEKAASNLDMPVIVKHIPISKILKYGGKVQLRIKEQCLYSDKLSTNKRDPQRASATQAICKCKNRKSTYVLGLKSR